MQPTHTAATVPRVQPIDDSSAEISAQSINEDAASLPPMRPIDPTGAIENVGQCAQLKNIFIQMLRHEC